jgi:hypothetical protein
LACRITTDGRTIAFAGDYEGNLDVYVVAATGHLAQLLNGFVEVAVFGGVAMRALKSS